MRKEVIGNAALYLGDCMEYMKGCADKSFDLAIVDPPYGIGEDASHNNTGDRPTAKWPKTTSQKYKVFDDSSAPDAEYFKELMRVSKHQIIWGGNHFADKLPPSSGWVVWDKKADIKEHLSMCELAWSSFSLKCNKFEYLWAGFKKAEQTIRIHPTQKPVKLYEWLLTNYAKPGQRILDTHLGSGSSAIACNSMGYELTGIEIDEDYYGSACQRIEQAQKQIRMFA